jgi:hypothetical protein
MLAPAAMNASLFFENGIIHFQKIDFQCFIKSNIGLLKPYLL